MCTRLPFISWSIVGVPSSQALPGYRITAPPSVCVPDVIGTLVVWIHKKKKSYPPAGSASKLLPEVGSGTVSWV